MTVVERLGPSHPRSFLVAAEAFSSSVDCTQSNSYSNQDLDYGLLHGATRPRFDAARTTFYLPRRGSGVWVGGWSAIHFPSALIRQVSCNTLLGGCRLLWPPSCCLYQRTSFSLCAPVAHRNPA